MLVNIIYGSKELFVNEYFRLLANPCSYDTDKEIRYLELLQLKFLSTSVRWCSRILETARGWTLSCTQWMEDVLSCRLKHSMSTPWSSQLSSGLSSKQSLWSFHMKLTEALDAHTKVLQTLKGNRNLVWKPHLGFANIDLDIGDKKINLTVSPIHAAIIYKFQEAAVEWTAQKLATSLKVPLSTLRRKITFWQS